MGDTTSTRGRWNNPTSCGGPARGAPPPRLPCDDSDHPAGPWSPWRYLREHHPHIRVVEAELPAGYLGCLDHRDHTIWLDSRLLCHEQRSTLAHEIGHLELDWFVQGQWAPAAEWRVDVWAARHLIPIGPLLQAFKWTSQLDEMAEELFVDSHTLRTRLRCMTDEEQDQAMAAIYRRGVSA